MQAHPGLAKAMAVAVGVLSASLLVLGPLLLGIASVLGPYAMVHILLAKIGVSGGVLSVVMRGLAGSFNLVMMVIGTLGRLLLLNPIGLAVTAIGLAAYLLVKYWEPIKAFFTGLWSEVTGASGVGSAASSPWSQTGPCTARSTTWSRQCCAGSASTCRHVSANLAGTCCRASSTASPGG